MSGLFNSLGGNDDGAVLNVICWVKPSSAASCWIYIDCLAMVRNLLAMTEQQGQRERKERESSQPVRIDTFFVTHVMHRRIVNYTGSILTI